MYEIFRVNPLLIVTGFRKIYHFVTFDTLNISSSNQALHSTNQHCSKHRISLYHELPEILWNISNLAQNNPNSPIWIAGDFNLPDINWEDGSIIGHNYPHSFAELLLDFIINTFGFTQTVDSPTRRNNTLDLFFTNQPSLVTSCIILGFNNHEIVYVSNHVITPSNFSARYVPLWHKADFDLIRETILNFSDCFLNKHTTDTPVNILWEEYKSLCESCLTLVPHTQTSDKHCSPWITKQIKRLSRQKQQGSFSKPF